jgi:tight adherence protein B
VVEGLLDQLAGLIRCGLPLRQSLLVLPDAAGSTERAGALVIARYLRLGASTTGGVRKLLECCGFDESLAPLVAGGEIDVANLLSNLARQAKEQRVADEAGRAAAAGARLSGRMVAGLPLLFVPLAPAANASVWDAGGLLLLFTGAVLALVGLWWIDRLLPSPPRPDPAGSFADLVAVLLKGGAGTSQALHSAALCNESSDAAVGQARRRVLLGASWEIALTSAGSSGYTTLAAIVKRGRSLGLDIAADLEEFARVRRVQREAHFDAEIRKAPIKMVVPLVTCVLPAFVIVSFGPFLRGVL